MQQGLGDGKCASVLGVILLTPSPTQAQSPRILLVIGQGGDYNFFNEKMVISVFTS